MVAQSQYRKSHAAVIALVALVVGLAGCASSIPPPTGQIAAARVLINEAETEGAPRYAPVELLAARESLAKAEAATRAEDNLTARRMAERAESQAQLAQTQSRAAKAEQAASEVRAGIESLRRELERRAR